MNANHVYLVDDNNSVRKSLSRLIEHAGYIVHSFENANDFLRNEKIEDNSIFIFDVRMPDMSGVELQRNIIEKLSYHPVIFISGESDSKEIIEAFKNGAVDFILKPFDFEVIEKSIKKAFKLLSDYISSKTLKDLTISNLSKLTPRESEVLNLMVNGLRLKEVANQLSISVSTIKIHKSRILEKMQNKSIVEITKLIEISKL
jgi:FixJ family two-component response regulator